MLMSSTAIGVVAGGLSAAGLAGGPGGAVRRRPRLSPIVAVEGITARTAALPTDRAAVPCTAPSVRANRAPGVSRKGERSRCQKQT